jgi:hypothetical protein
MSHYCAVSEARGRMPCMDQCDDCRDYEEKESAMTQAPSCNGSQQESQKLTGDAAGETTTPRTDAFSSVIAAQGTAKPAWYEFARQLERESSELKAQLEGFRKDAERYRWLRSNIGMYYGGDQRDGQQWKLDGLDAAIDSAQEEAE